jgi:hypothetical protein
MRHSVCIAVFFVAGSFSAFASVDSSLLSMVPAEAKIVGSIDVSRARTSDFGQYLLSRAQGEDSHFQEMMDQTGFDPRRDLQNIIFATGDPGATGKRHSFAILARGNFDTGRIKALAAGKGAAIVTYQGVDMIVNAKDKDKGQQTAIGFPETGVAVMADLETLKEIIGNRAMPATLDGDLQSKINSIGGSNDAWFVSLVGGSFLADHMRDNHAGKQGSPQAKALQGVVQSSGGVKLGSMIETTFDAVTRSAEDARSLSDVIRFLASMVQMQRQSDPRAGILATALDGMTLENSGTGVHFAVSMPEKSLEQLADAGSHAMTH